MRPPLVIDVNTGKGVPGGFKADTYKIDPSKMTLDGKKAFLKSLIPKPPVSIPNLSPAQITAAAKKSAHLAAVQKAANAQAVATLARAEKAGRISIPNANGVPDLPEPPQPPTIPDVNNRVIPKVRVMAGSAASEMAGNLSVSELAAVKNNVEASLPSVPDIPTVNINSPIPQIPNI